MSEGCKVCSMDDIPLQSYEINEPPGRIMLCEHCWKKYLDPMRKGDPSFTPGELIPPRPYAPGRAPQQGQQQQVPPPEGWPNYVPYPPQPGMPLPPGWVWDSTGIHKV